MLRPHGRPMGVLVGQTPVSVAATGTTPVAYELRKPDHEVSVIHVGPQTPATLQVTLTPKGAAPPRVLPPEQRRRRRRRRRRREARQTTTRRAATMRATITRIAPRRTERRPPRRRGDLDGTVDPFRPR